MHSWDLYTWSFSIFINLEIKLTFSCVCVCVGGRWLRLVWLKFRAGIFKVKRSHKYIQNLQKTLGNTVITSDVSILMCTAVHYHIWGSRRHNCNFVFTLLGPINAAVAAAPGGGVCSCMHCFWVVDSQLKIWVTLSFQLTFLILQFLCCVSFILTMFFFQQ